MVSSTNTSGHDTGAKEGRERGLIQQSAPAPPVPHPSSSLRDATEVRGLNKVLREPCVATGTSELLDYAGWVHPLAAADVLAGETTEKRRYVCTAVSTATLRSLHACCLCGRFRRFMHHLRSSGDLSEKQIRMLGRPRFSSIVAA